MTFDYRMHLDMGLLAKYKPTAQELIKAQLSRFNQLVKDPKNKIEQERFRYSSKKRCGSFC